MAKAVKSVARIALPIAGYVLGGMVGMPMLGSVIGGAVGGGMGGGGLRGAVMGGLTAGATAGMGGFDWANLGTNAAGQAGAQAGANAVGQSLTSRVGDFISSVPQRLGNFAADPLGQIGGAIQNYGGQAVDYISGIPDRLMNATTAQVGSGAGATAGTAAQAGTNVPAMLGYGLMQGNQFMAEQSAADALKSSQQLMSAYQPYMQLGNNAVSRMQEIQSDPTAYIKNNPLYTSLAADAERRLLANKAASGKVGSGGTANELQTQLLNLGTGLVNNELTNLQGQANLGYGAAGNYGAAQAAGTMGVNNTYNNAYQNQINTMLAMSGVNPAMMAGRVSGALGI